MKIKVHYRYPWPALSKSGKRETYCGIWNVGEANTDNIENVTCLTCTRIYHTVELLYKRK